MSSPNEGSSSVAAKGVDVIALDQQLAPWAACYDSFGKQAADVATYEPLEVSAEQ